MWRNHEKAINNLQMKFQNDPNFEALIINGSIASNRARKDSDVDLILVATGEEYKKRKQIKNLHYFTRNEEHETGVVDGKIVSVNFLREAAKRGSEPTRAAFQGSFTVFCKDPEIEQLIRKIPIYQEHEQKEKIKSFFAQFQAAKWYFSQAEKRNDSYLRLHVVNKMVLFGGRLILAHNKILYPYHKWFLQTLDKTENKPKDLMLNIHNIIKNPNQENVDKLFNCIVEFTDWDKPEEGWVMRFNEDSEYNWLYNVAPLEDR